MKTYAIEIMGRDKPTYVLAEEVAKVIKATNAGARMVYVGGDFINPSSISRIRREYNVDVSVLIENDPEIIALLDNKTDKNLLK